MAVPDRAADYPYKVVGQTPHVAVAIHPGMIAGPAAHYGLDLVKEMMSCVETYYMRFKTQFGFDQWDVPRLTLVISPMSKNHGGVGGYHYPADFRIYSDVLMSDDKKSYNGLFTRFVFCCELLEMFTEYNPNINSWNSDCDSCEALSRVVASSMVPGQLRDGGWHFETSPSWLNSNRPNYLSQETVNYNALTIGCNVCALYWMHTKLGIPFAKIIQSGASKMEDVFKKATGLSGCYNRMIVDVNKKFPAGHIVDYTDANDNVWN